MSIAQNKPVVPPVKTDLSLQNFSSIIQKNLSDLHQAAHVHRIVTAPPGVNDGNVGDIYAVDNGLRCYLTVKTADLGWIAQTGAAFNVKDYGAKGDGRTDDVIPIQMAIDAAAKVRGGAVLFPTGTYAISRSLRVKYTTALYGLGAVIENADSDYTTKSGAPGYTTGVVILQTTANADGIFIQQEVTGSYKIEFHISNILVAQSADSTSGDGIRVDAGDVNFNVRCVWKNVYVYGFGGNGVNLVQGYYGSTFDTVSCFFNGYAGWIATGTFQGEYTVKNLRCFSNGRNGSTETDQTGCYVASGGTGVHYDRVSCTDNKLVNAYFKGMHFVLTDFQSESIRTNSSSARSLILESCAISFQGGYFSPGSGFLGKIIDARSLIYSSLTNLEFLESVDPSGYHIYEDGSSTANIYSYSALVGSPLTNIQATSWVFRSAEGMSFIGRDEVFSGIKDHKNGLKLGNIAGGTSNTQIYGSASPVAGTWRQGDIVWNTGVVTGGFAGWICTGAGTPGTWKTFAAVS